MSPVVLVFGALVVAIAQTLGWAWQQRRRNAGIVDVIWAGGLGFAAIWLATWGDGALLPRLTLAVLGGAWSLRLARHLWRRVRAGPEDGRYAQLRRRWGDHGAKWLAMFLFQAALVVLFAVPFAAVARNPVATAGPGWWLGFAVWVCAVSGEALADRQLARFRADPGNAGGICRDGLWRYSRHPNYFFEWLHWWAYVGLAIGSPIAAWAWLGPVVMYLFLRYLSGVPFTEAQALRTRGEAYRHYQRTTPMFFPWFPKEAR